MRPNINILWCLITNMLLMLEVCVSEMFSHTINDVDCFNCSLIDVDNTEPLL